MPIAPNVIAKAVRNNPIFARRLGWTERFQQISQKIGFTNMSPGPEAFAEGVFRWQGSHPPLKADGMLGPKTWERMEPETRFTASSGTLPEWMRKVPPMPEPAAAHAERPEVSSNCWFGLSVDWGGHLGIGGINTLYAQLYSLDTYERRFRIECERGRLGLGLGGGIGFNFLLFMGVPSPSDLQGWRMTGWDFQIALGARWAEVIKNAGKVRGLQRMVRQADQSGGGIRRMIQWARENKQAITQMNHDEWFAIAKRLREASSVAGMDTNARSPSMISLGIPTPGSLEVSAYYEGGRVRVFGIVDDAGT